MRGKFLTFFLFFALPELGRVQQAIKIVHETLHPKSSGPSGLPAERAQAPGTSSINYSRVNPISI